MDSAEMEMLTFMLTTKKSNVWLSAGLPYSFYKVEENSYSRVTEK